MPRRRGVSLHIAMPQTPGKWDPLPSAADDAAAMEAIARDAGWQVRKRLTCPRVAEVTEALRAIAYDLAAGDQALITYSGHGDQVNGGQTWVLLDDHLTDREMFDLLARFKPGVRVLLISDSCHSGTITTPANERYGPACSLISMAAAVDSDNAYVDPAGWYGVFTRAIVDTWRHGRFDGGHRDLFNQAAGRARKYQRPFYYRRGDDQDDLRLFEDSRPFDLGSEPPPMK